MTDVMDHYRQLGITKAATDSEIKKAYKKLALKYHPDKNKNEHAQERFKLIVESYAVLSDPTRKAEYDRKQSFTQPSNNSSSAAFGSSSFSNYRPWARNTNATNGFYPGFGMNASNFHSSRTQQQLNQQNNTRTDYNFYKGFSEAFQRNFFNFDDLDYEFYRTTGQTSARFGNPNVNSYNTQSTPKTSRYQQGTYANNFKKKGPYFNDKKEKHAGEDSSTSASKLSFSEDSNKDQYQQYHHHQPHHHHHHGNTDKTPNIKSTNDEKWTSSKTLYSYVSGKKFTTGGKSPTSYSNSSINGNGTSSRSREKETPKETPNKTSLSRHPNVNDPNTPDAFNAPGFVPVNSTDIPKTPQSGLRGAKLNELKKSKTQHQQSDPKSSGSESVGGTKTDPIVIEEEKSFAQSSKKPNSSRSPLDEDFFSKRQHIYASPGGFQYKREAVKPEKDTADNHEHQDVDKAAGSTARPNENNTWDHHQRLEELLKQSANDLKRPSLNNKRFRHNSRSTTPLSKKNIFQNSDLFNLSKKPAIRNIKEPEVFISKRPLRSNLEANTSDESSNYGYSSGDGESESDDPTFIEKRALNKGRAEPGTGAGGKTGSKTGTEIGVQTKADETRKKVNFQQNSSSDDDEVEEILNHMTQPHILHLNSDDEDLNNDEDLNGNEDLNDDEELRDYVNVHNDKDFHNGENTRDGDVDDDEELLTSESQQRPGTTDKDQSIIDMDYDPDLESSRDDDVRSDGLAATSHGSLHQNSVPKNNSDNKFTLHNIDNIPPFTQNKSSNFDLNGILSSLDPNTLQKQQQKRQKAGITSVNDESMQFSANRTFESQSPLAQPHSQPSQQNQQNNQNHSYHQRRDSPGLPYLGPGDNQSNHFLSKDPEALHIPVNKPLPNVYIHPKSQQLNMNDLNASEAILQVHPPVAPPFLTDLSRSGWIIYQEKIKQYQEDWLKYCDYINTYNAERTVSMHKNYHDIMNLTTNANVYFTALQQDINVHEEWVFARKTNMEVMKHYFENLKRINHRGGYEV